jgi:hypothetical protein
MTQWRLDDSILQIVSAKVSAQDLCNSHTLIPIADFIQRLRTGRPLNVYDTATFYIRDNVKGYIDYPTLDLVANTKVPQIPPESIGSMVAKL